MPVATIKKITTTIPPGKIKCYISGILRKDTPEEHVRQRVARSLVEEYGYHKNDIALEFKIYIGSDKKRADIVIFHAGSERKSDNIICIIEAKRDSIKPTHADQGIGQLKSYMSATPNAEYGMWVGSEVRAFHKDTSKKAISYQEVLDLPSATGKVAAPSSFSALVPATDILKDVFKRCHSYISANQGGSKEFAFHEFLKITFCKVFDEKFSEAPRFFITPSEQKTSTGKKAVADRIEALYQDVCTHYGYIFGDGDTIKLNPEVLSYIVNELQKYSLLDTDFDYKGQAYEEIVGANSRGERGEFFTPRNLCALAVQSMIEIIGEDKILSTRVLDPACGTGGFLRTYVHELFQLLLKRESAKWGDNPKAREKAKEALKALCDQNVFGIDFNPVLVRAAQMNLVMHGDGSSNIFHENSLLSWGEWSDKTRAKLTEGSVDLVITNPPFGEDLLINDPHILDQFALSSFLTRTRRSAMAPQELFIERCHRLLRDGGYLAIVTPDNILSNPSYKFMRSWIVLHYTIIASIWLPGEMFQPSTGTQTSLLILKKRKKPIKSLERLAQTSSDEPLFLSVPKRIGHDQRGAFIPLRDEDGDVVVRQVTKKRYFRDVKGGWEEETYEVSEPVANDDLPKVLEDFKVWLKEVDL